MKIIQRNSDALSAQSLQQAGEHPLLAQLFSSRGVKDAKDLDLSLKLLLPPSTLKGNQEAAQLLADAIASQKRICIVADYDCDGATACALGVTGLRLLGAKHVEFLVPDRINDGYGLTPTISQRVKSTQADVLITVDNGIASLEGVRVAKDLGLQVIITDHHLPAQELPNADVIVNPNQMGCPFESKNLAGVGVMFYVLLALRAELRSRGLFDNDQNKEPKLDQLLPLVALGSVADVVSLDVNNRRLVHQGLERIKKGLMPQGLRALIDVCAREHTQLSSDDLGYAIGPRINAAGRLSDMTLGIECLITDDQRRARELADMLDQINKDRKSIELDMKEQALEIAMSLFEEGTPPPAALCIFEPDFHEGVIGIVASRVKDLYHRPTFVFANSTAKGKEHMLKGSGRSIAGFHLRDALDLMSKRYPSLIAQFGGHAMAAGCSIEEDQLALFEVAFQELAFSLLDPADLNQEMLVDGSLGEENCDLNIAKKIKSTVWGQGFSAPIFTDELQVVEQRIVGEQHLSLKLKLGTRAVDGIWFGRTERLGPVARLAYKLDIDKWRGAEKLKLFIQSDTHA
jgi:single-stranded-DNA-specific exonuclease